LILSMSFHIVNMNTASENLLRSCWFRFSSNRQGCFLHHASLEVCHRILFVLLNFLFVLELNMFICSFTFIGIFAHVML
jgi:hypothetical protein